MEDLIKDLINICNDNDTLSFDIINTLMTSETICSQIPEYIARYIIECKESNIPLQKAANPGYDVPKVGWWINNNYEAFVRAWLLTYNVRSDEEYIIETPFLTEDGTPGYVTKLHDQNFKVVGYGIFARDEEMYQVFSEDELSELPTYIDKKWIEKYDR